MACGDLGFPTRDLISKPCIEAYSLNHGTWEVLTSFVTLAWALGQTSRYGSDIQVDFITMDCTLWASGTLRRGHHVVILAVLYLLWVVHLHVSFQRDRLVFARGYCVGHGPSDVCLFNDSEIICATSGFVLTVMQCFHHFELLNSIPCVEPSMIIVSIIRWK